MVRLLSGFGEKRAVVTARFSRRHTCWLSENLSRSGLVNPAGFVVRLR